MTIRIGTAGWTIPAAFREGFPAEGSTLERYAERLSCAEINSSFYRSHRPATWERWAASVPEDFRFSVKMPKAITHEAKLVDCSAAVARFAEEVGLLGATLGVVLIQLPPKLEFDSAVASDFLASVRQSFSGDVAMEPRNASWLTPEADACLIAHRIARVAADPPKPEGSDVPGGWPDFAYYRLHGSPRTYFSAYSREFIDRLAGELAAAGRPAWCIFDNTAGSAAAGNALELMAALG